MSTAAKAFIAVLIAIPTLELIFYLILFHYITEHNKEMQRNNVISKELFMKRRHINIFSLYAQVFGFAVEVSFFAFNLSVKLLGRRLFPPKFREYSNVLVHLVFCTNSTVQILASSELRNKFFAMFGR